MQRLLGRWLTSSSAAAATAAAAATVGGGVGNNSGGNANRDVCAAADAAVSSRQLHYTLSTFRFHNDVRPSSKVVVLHDYLSNAAEWPEALHGDDDDDADAAAAAQRRREALALLLSPLEVYCVDLVGHARSAGVAPVARLLEDADGAAYTLACAAAVTRRCRCVLTTGEAPTLCGVNFGAMVACQAALQAPDAYRSLGLVVRSPTQLWTCTPRTYAAREVLCAAPRRVRSLTELHEYLATAAAASSGACLMTPRQRHVLLSAATLSRDDAGVCARLHYDEALLQRTQPLRADALLTHATAPYTRPVFVLVTEPAATTAATATDDEEAEALRRLYRHFPLAKVVRAQAPRRDGRGLDSRAEGDADGGDGGDTRGESDVAQEQRRRVAMMRMAVVPRAVVDDIAGALRAAQPFLVGDDEEQVEQLLRTMATWDA